MKCVAIAMLSVGAYAVQDTTPPVISLTLGSAHAHKAHSCAVYSSMKDCPDPVCSAHDHHDGAFDCEKKVENVNNDNDTTNLLTTVGNTADRNVRSEWLYSYDATDASGNKAETVTFALTMYDHVKPVFTINSGIFTDKANMESCNAGRHSGLDGSPAFGTHADPCTWTVPANTAQAHDNYDKNVDARIKSALKKGSKPTVLATNKDHDINTQQTGTWYLAWSVCDKAEQFGAGSGDNCETAEAQTTISDTTPPVITVHKDTTASNTYECGTDGVRAGTSKSTYVEHGAMCQDLADSWVSTKYVDTAMKVNIHESVDTSVEKVYTVGYDCTDKAGHKVSDTRTVTVKDTTAPVITLNGDHIVENSAGAHVSTAGKTMDTGLFDSNAMHNKATCVDACYPTTKIVSTLHYGACPTDASGDYANDAAVAAHDNLVGNGDLSNFPEYTAGDYSVKYVCTDGAGLTDATCRTIRNVDHTKPVIQILGSDSMTLEATHEGNYIDDGATCSDQVDGVISQNVEVSADVVNLSKVGTYRITYNCKDAANRAAETAERVVTVAQTSCPTCDMVCATTLSTEVTGDQTVVSCEQQHEASFQYTDAGAACSDVIDGATDHTCTLSFEAGTEGKEDSSRSEVAEVTGTNVSCDGQLVNADRIGTYVITYRSVNSVGKANDDTTCRGGYYNYIRSVQVVDTLKPVITLKYGSDIVAQGPVDDTTPKGTTEGSINADGTNHGGAHKGTVNTPRSGIAGQAAFSEQTLMAEDATTSGVNGWVLGAIASAVTGLALLGYSQRKTTVATSVPV
jgi:hypothetical protein